MLECNCYFNYGYVIDFCCESHVHKSVHGILNSL